VHLEGWQILDGVDSGVIDKLLAALVITIWNPMTSCINLSLFPHCGRITGHDFTTGIAAFAGADFYFTQPFSHTQ